MAGPKADTPPQANQGPAPDTAPDIAPDTTPDTARGPQAASPAAPDATPAAAGDLAARAEDAASHVLRLYVAGTTARSARAVATARRILESRLPGRYMLAVVDIYQDPEAARVHQIVAVPTLIRLRPLPLRRLIGDLSNETRVLAALGLDAGP